MIIKFNNPLGDVQDTYSLGLMRNGEYDKARAENELVLLKISFLRVITPPLRR
jgi:hypothetical protein